MMKSRGAAVMGAFVLIVLAIFVRGLLVDGDGDGGGSDGPKKNRGGDLPVVACTPDLIEICETLATEGLIADKPPELDLPEAADPPTKVDGWITWNPAPAIANFVASPGGSTTVWDKPKVLGSASEQVLIDATTELALARTCLDDRTWRCLAGEAPGLSIGVGDPTTAGGIARLAPFASALADGNDADFVDWMALDDVVRSPAAGQVNAATGTTRLATQPGFLSMVAGPESLLKRQTRTEAGTSRGLRVLDVAPSARLALVLAPRTGREDELDDLACEGLPGSAKKAITDVGLATCMGRADDALAGFLYQVQKRVG